MRLVSNGRSTAEQQKIRNRIAAQATVERRKAAHECINCGRQDENTLAGRVRCAVCAEIVKEKSAKIRKFRIENHLCVVCGKSDEYTAYGGRKCKKCAEAQRRYNRTAYEKRRRKVDESKRIPGAGDGNEQGGYTDEQGPTVSRGVRAEL